MCEQKSQTLKKYRISLPGMASALAQAKQQMIGQSNFKLKRR
jgi:hypothetical protein